jgi:predicted metal-binding transcription factor (methanogenesis marker protein 9)
LFILVENKTDMKKVVLLGLLVLGLVSCKKDEKVLMKYAYITQDNVDYKNEKGYGVITTHLCPIDKPSSMRDIEIERDNQKFLTEMKGKKVLADTLVDVNSDITEILFSKLK